MKVLLIAIGGIFGALSRYYLVLLVEFFNKSSALGVLSANILASFIAGIVFVVVIEKHLSELIALLLLVGFAGSFSTMSALSLEAVQMFYSGDYIKAFSYMFISLFCSIAATFVGVIIGRNFI